MRRLFTVALAGLLYGLTLGPVLGPTVAEAAAVDINTASVEQLEGIPGIGPAKAKAIVEYRRDTPFAETEELQNVRGIGSALYERIKDHVRVGSSTER